jgi:hypothetical protein
MAPRCTGHEREPRRTGLLGAQRMDGTGRDGVADPHREHQCGVPSPFPPLNLHLASARPPVPAVDYTRAKTVLTGRRSSRARTLSEPTASRSLLSRCVPIGTFLGVPRSVAAMGCPIDKCTARRRAGSRPVPWCRSGAWPPGDQTVTTRSACRPRRPSRRVRHDHRRSKRSGHQA